MSTKRNRHSANQKMNIEIRLSLQEVCNWLYNRLLLLGAKYSFQTNELDENNYIFIDNISPELSGFSISTNLNGNESLGVVTISMLELGDGNVSVLYRYPSKLLGFVSCLNLDLRAHFNLNIPQDMENKARKPEPPSNDFSSVLEIELFFENLTSDQLCDWLVVKTGDILRKLFPTQGGLLEIQPPKIHIQSKYERRVEMAGRLYEFGARGTALYSPFPPQNQQCLHFEIRQPPSARMHVLCKVNRLALEYFRDLLDDIEHNWPETRENIQRFLIDHRGETVIPIMVRFGPMIDNLTGEVVQEIPKYQRMEYLFRGTPAQFSSFVLNYGDILSNKFKREVFDILGSKTNINPYTIQSKAVFFPIEDIAPENQRGIYGEIRADSLGTQNSTLTVEVQMHCWKKVEETWHIIYSELKRQGRIDDNISLLSQTDDKSLKNESHKNILIVTITKTETQAVRDVFSKAIGQDWIRRPKGKKTYYDLGMHGNVPVFMVQSEMGTATPGGALLTVREAIQNLCPQAIIMCGIAFGLRPDKHQLGDILVAKQLAYYESQKVDSQKGVLNRGDRITASERLLDRFRSGDNDWKGAPVHFGLVLTGEKVVNDASFRDELMKLEPEAIGGEMEGEGLYVAARDDAVDWILVKAICDWADGTKNDDAQPKAAHNAAEFVLHVLQLGSFE